jgi:hypothetical protein
MMAVRLPLFTTLVGLLEPIPDAKMAVAAEFATAKTVPLFSTETPLP